MGRGDSCKLVVKAFVYWVWGPWFLAQEGRYSTLGAKTVSERGAGGCGKGLQPGAISSVLSPGFSRAVPFWNAQGLLCSQGSLKPCCTFPEAPCIDAKPCRPHLFDHGLASHYPQPLYREGSLQDPGVHK